MLALDTIPTRRVRWQHAVRVIPSRYPPINLFERVANPDDLDATIAVECETNERLLNEIGQLDLVPQEDRVTGAGAGYIMAAFTHVSPIGSRFAPPGAYGVYYCAREEATAIAETVYHREQFMRESLAPAMDLEQRMLVAELDGTFHDIREIHKSLAVYDPDAYTESERVGSTLRTAGSHGLVYDSARRSMGQCAAVFRPRLIHHCRQTKHLVYRWDGTRIASVYRIELVQ